MAVTLKNLLSVISVFATVVYARAVPDHQHEFKPADIITRDVCIIGGGASGTYAAVRLREDMNKTVIVVEQKDRLGGHTETYIDPVTHFPVNYGVQAYHNLDVVKKFFGRFGVPLVTVSNPFPQKYVDLRTGKVVPGYPSADPSTALKIYAGQIQKYPYLVGGYFLPDPIPDDLLLPFGDFVKKYGIEAAMPVIYTFAHGVGDILSTPTLYVIQNFGLPQLADLFANSFLTTAHHINSELYLAATALLGKDVLLNSTVISADRPSNPKGIHEIIVSTPTGRKLIRANKLLITIPPKTCNLEQFDLTHTEEEVFEQWQYSNYYAGVIRNTGIPDGVSIINAAPSTPLNLPPLPAIIDLDFSGIPNLFTFAIVSTSDMSPAQAKQQITSGVLSMGTAGTFNTTQPTFEVISSHTPTQFKVGTKALKSGFYKKLYALQGLKQTWWTGAAWAPDDSSLLWQFTDAVVLPALAA